MVVSKTGYWLVQKGWKGLAPDILTSLTGLVRVLVILGMCIFVLVTEECHPASDPLFVSKRNHLAKSCLGFRV